MAFQEIGMTENRALDVVYDWLLKRNLSEALNAMEGYLASYSGPSDADRLYSIKADFHLMSDYWKRGFRDPQLPVLYDSLLHRLYVIYANAALSYSIKHSTYLTAVNDRLSLATHDWTVQVLKEALEAYVADGAMLALEPEHTQAEKKKALHQRHHQLIADWFDRLWLSAIWRDSQASAMEEILLSPTIDSNDQQVLTSAVMLATLNHFDIVKFKVLLTVYRQSTDTAVRQRALVGWVLALQDDIFLSLYGEERKELEELLADKAVCQELVQLQHQIILCINAEKDNQTIQQEIMPDLLKNNGFRVTRNGIEEVEDHSLDDILHPDAEERRMEQVEESFLRMQEMQKQGSDIYFGGFSQMKRYDFFREICNWFVPFYPDHPGIADVASKLKNNAFMKSLMQAGPFCHSDKYSFLLAFNQVINHIPKNLWEMMERGEASVSEVMPEDSQSDAYIRRIYLQDLYRFFRLYPYRSEFSRPFEDCQYLFMAKKVFSRTHIEAYFNDMAAFLIKQKRLHEAGMVLENCGEARCDFRHYMMCGYLLQHRYYDFGPEKDALYCYQQALALEPENEKAQQGYARALFDQERYQEALEAYDKLLTIQPEKKHYLLNRAVCLTNLGRYADALKDLYRLNFESADDKNVNRVLAWTLTCDGKYEQAEKIYAQLLTGRSLPEDLLNNGYCLWLGGHVDEAADCFHRYLKETREPKTFIIENELALLREKGITEPEMQMMLYML
ncbi:MAG: tetratricopeptide repeat protein [Prevotella sp.]|nr:tetratricopeptide repeat protein [Prevotella sp.]